MHIFETVRNLRPSRFFQISLLLPIVFWGVGLVVVSLTFKQDIGEIRQNLYNGHHIFLPYMLFTVVMWKLVDNKPYGLLMFMAFAVPILWGCFFTVWYVVVSYLLTGNIESWFVLVIMAFWAAFVGYLCEVIPFWVIRRFKENFKAVEKRAEALSAQ